MNTGPVKVFSLAYISTATAEMHAADLAALLIASRRNNRTTGITGFLLYKDGRFLQYLEGAEDAVRALVRVIASDPRHRNIAVLLETYPAKRLLPQWTMGFEGLNNRTVTTIPKLRHALKGPGGISGAQTALLQLVEWFQTPTARSESTDG